MSKIESPLARAFDSQFRSLAPDLPRPEAEWKFHEGRAWLFDRAWPDRKVAVELEGGSHGRRIVCHNCGETVRAITSRGPGRELRAGGVHQQRARFGADMEKYNIAQLDGWLVLRFAHDDVIGNPFSMIETIRQALESRAWALKRGDEPLTAYQERLLHMIAGGFSQREIGLRLNADPQAIKKQATVICSKLQTTNRASAVARGILEGLIDPSRIVWAWDEFLIAGDDDET